jgi:hypothetical protein
MGSGRMAYRLKKGCHARIVDLVQIFEVGPDVIPAPVAAQRAFFEEWLASLRLTQE